MKSPLFFAQAVLLITIVHVGCEDLGTQLDDLSAQYKYEGYNLNGTPVVSGVLTIRRSDGAIDGQKNLTGEIPESGEGSIYGLILESGIVRVFLSPSPTVTYIEGNLSDGLIQGDRFAVSDRPPIPFKVGTFKAVRVMSN